MPSPHSRLVMKFGGTSVADMTRIRRAAELVAAEAKAGKAVAVVVSAMAGVTNQYVTWTDVAGPPAPGLGDGEDEYDVVVSSGEQVTAGLMTMVLRNLGVASRSWLGWQVPIHTDTGHGHARITGVEADTLGPAIDQGVVAVVPGFQGLGADGRITTLGRGGSDTTAVALAAALQAPCDIYTDVDGVYTTDPRVEPKARRLAQVCYPEMLEMAAMGAKVLAARAVELAYAHQVPVRVLSSFSEPGQPRGGTWILNEDQIMEHRLVSAVAHSLDEAKITLRHLPDHPGTAARIFDALGAADINVDMIVQARSEAQARADLAFSVGRRDARKALAAVKAAQEVIGFSEVLLDEGVAKVSVIGVGMRSHAGVAQTLFATLAAQKINVQAISTSEIKISVLVEEAQAESAVKALHAAYGLAEVSTQNCAATP